MNNKVQEKRRFIRFRLLAQGTLTVSNGEMYSGTLRDISIGGVFLDISGFSANYLNEDIVAYIEVSIDGDKHVIDAHAKIARITEDGVGLFFNHMDDQSKISFSKIIQKIKERLKSD